MSERGSGLAEVRLRTIRSRRGIVDGHVWVVSVRGSGSVVTMGCMCRVSICDGGVMSMRGVSIVRHDIAAGDLSITRSESPDRFTDD